jgi:hypothetical protein
MTKRNPVSAIQNIWFDAEQVDAEDLNTEQSYNNSIQSSIINNHIGTGILVDSLAEKILFSSDAVQGLLDGKILTAQSQPSDNNYGNQLEIILQKSKAAGKRSVKVGIIGLDFQQNLQYETFTFKVNESQITKKHYTAILQVLINDFRGSTTESFNLGGSLIIKEVSSYSMSRSASMISQMVQPNLFFRDFFVVPPYNDIYSFLKAGLPYYNVDKLNISIQERDNKVISVNDVTTQIGQKFQATTNNIQKVTLLLSASNSNSNPDDYKWNGDIVVTVYPLQTALQCPTDIPPESLIGYSPSPVPIAQIVYTYDTLFAAGVQLNTVPQPVDFIFSSTPLGNGSSVVPGNYYAVTFKRSGTADKGDLYISTGDKVLSDSISKMTVFNGTIWVDLPDEDLWFNISSSSAKVTDGQAYVSGNGVTLSKVEKDQNTGETTDYCLDNLYFTGADTFRGVVFVDTEKNTPVQDLRTGNLVYSRQQNVPDIRLLSSLDISNLSQTTDPLLIGAIADKNVKFLDVSNDASFYAKLFTFSLFDNQLFVKRVVDPNDPRYDASTNFLETRLLKGELTKIKIYPDFANSPSIYYRVANAELVTVLYGDVNGDGYISQEDLDLLNTYRGFDFNYTPPLLSTRSHDIVNNTTTFVNGYYSYQSPFINAVNVLFEVVDANNNKVIASGSDGVLVVNPSGDPRKANFSSASVDFANLIPAVGGNKLVIRGSASESNNGGFEIIELDSITDAITIRKIILNQDTILQLFRADINEDYQVTEEDAVILEKYINKSAFSLNPIPPVYNKIGTTFNVIRLVLEKYDTNDTIDSVGVRDRNDDYFTDLNTRNVDIHLLGDIFIQDYAQLQNRDMLNNPPTLFFQKQFSWEDYLVVCNSKNKLTQTIFESQQDTIVYGNNLNGITVEGYNTKPDFDPGSVTMFVPDNLIIGQGGEIIRDNGEFYKIDFEVGTIVLEIPMGMLGAERSINVFDDFVQDYNGNGITRLGYPAMRFADSSFVKSDALTKDQLRFSVSLQSFSPNNDGVDPNGLAGVIVDGKMGVDVDYTNGIVTLNFTNLYQDPILTTLTTRVQINVFLKKGGFNNSLLRVDPTQVANLMKLISVFSGPVVGGASALVDLVNDVSGVLPIIHGGTGIDYIGSSGTVLMSNGTNLSYHFTTSYSLGVVSADAIAKADGYGLIDTSFYYKNPVFIQGVAGEYTTSAADPGITIGAFSFKFDDFILKNIGGINLEIIMKSGVGTNFAKARLFQKYVSSPGYLALKDIGTLDTNYLQTRDVDYSSIKSENLLTQLISIATSNPSNDSVFEVRLFSDDGTNPVYCASARLIITYVNPDNGVDFQPLPPIIT